MRRGRAGLPILVLLVVVAGALGSGPRLMQSLGVPGPGTTAPSVVASPQRPWNLVGLGDSITAGQGCPGCVPFLDLYAQQITKDLAVGVTVTNLGISGSTSTDLLASLSDTASAPAQQVSGAQVITVTIGANDFLPMLDTALRGECGGNDGLSCFDSALTSLRDNLTAIMLRIRDLRGGAPAAVRITGYWNVFLDGAVATQAYGPGYDRWSSLLTQRVNRVIKSVAETENSRYVDLFALFKGLSGDNDDTALLAPDGDHPSQVGHQEIAESLAQAGYAPLRNGP